MLRHAFRPMLLIVPIMLILSATVFLQATLPSRAASASITLSLAYGPPTSSVQVKGKGFKASETVTLDFDSAQVGSVKASSIGTFSATVTVPGSAQPGNHVMQAKGKSSGSVAQATFLVETDWVQQAFNRQHTGFNVFENVLSASNVSSLTESWAYTSNSWAPGTIAVAQGVVYFGCNQTYVCALSAATGQLLWSYNTNDQFVGTPAVASNLVYVNTAGGHVEALNATTGAQVWTYSPGFTINDAPLTANGLVYVGPSNGVLYALNSTTGQVVWKHSFPSVFSTPSIDGGQLFVSAGGNLYALNSQTGQVAWHAAANGDTPVIAGGIIYLNDPADGKLLALNEKTGALVWSDGSSFGDPAVANGVVYVAVPGACTLEALSGSSGAILWQYNSSDQPTCVQDTPIVANGVVYVGATDDKDPDCYCGAAYSISAATGAEVGYIENDHGDSSSGKSPIVVVNGVLYYAAADGVYAYHLA